jgi:hypothetical protein
MFNLIIRLPHFLSNLFYSDPYPDRATNMASGNSGFPTFATFQPCELPGFSM